MAQFQKPDAVFDNSRPFPKRIFLFDVDGTLTVPRKHITPDMHAYFSDLRKKVGPGHRRCSQCSLARFAHFACSLPSVIVSC